VKICIVSPYEHGGGAEYQMSVLIDALVADGNFEVHYLAHFIDERDRTRNYQVSAIGTGRRVPRLGYLMDARSLYRALRHINPGVIYQRVGGAYTGLCALYSRRLSIPMIWHVSSDMDIDHRLLERVRNIPRKLLEKWGIVYGARHATGVVVQTHHQAELLRKTFRRAADAVIPNFHPAAGESIDKSGPLTVVWIANLKPLKQPEVFVRLANRFASRTDIRFLMVGAPATTAGDQTWRNSLMQSIEAAANLDYLGEKSQAEVNNLLARAHILVNTSTHEGFPNTFIQAWLRDVAVVSLSVDPDGVLERDRVGITAHDEAGLETAVRKLLDDPNTLAAYTKRAREHARTHHSLANSRRLVELIQAFGSAELPAPRRVS
jgi:glycosyltransferase involved in cell wall biosynthesis